MCIKNFLPPSDSYLAMVPESLQGLFERRDGLSGVNPEQHDLCLVSFLQEKY